MQNPRSSVSANTPQGGIIWIKLAVLYLIVGIGLGIAMGSTQNFLLRPVHAHLNLLGWTTLALAGIVYAIFPQLAASRLAKVHFCMHNVSLPVMMASLTLVLLGHTEVVPVLAVSEIVAAGGVLVFASNIFMNLKPAPAAAGLTQLSAKAIA
ncbi:MAG TPA: hypothetical protein VFB54_10880, partial [Burkholderiales bacterium]|nr:hypothetical protein [Burkholderiales bacterium]